MVADVALNLTGIGPCILPERPSYGLAQKEFFRAKRRTNARIEQIEIGVPMVVRLDGTNSEEGLALLAEADLPNLTQEKTMLGAAEKVVELAA